MLPVDCQPPSTGASGSPAAAGAQQAPLPSLLMHIDIGACPAGTAVDALSLSQCLPCEPGTFNFDGLTCEACPLGVRAFKLAQ